jgi:hypothetical protein
MSPEEAEKKAHGIRFDALRNAIYHSSRRRFFELLSRCLSFLVVISGTAAVANLQILDPRLMAAIAAAIGALQLVFDFNGRARVHENLQRRYFELIAEVDAVATPTPADIEKWNAKWSLIYADEPPPMRGLDAISYNTACDSIGRSKSRLELSWYHLFFRHLYSFPNTQFSAPDASIEKRDE